MVPRDFVFWEVDVQRDFMLPGGNLYVPGAEKLLPNIKRLTDAARQGKVFLVSHGCFHPEGDPEFKIFPPHCLKGSPGSELVPEALAEKVVRVENDLAAKIPVVLHQQPCYCYCDRMGHNSLHSCFESAHGARCDICLKELYYAYAQHGKGKTAVQIRKGIMVGEWRQVNLDQTAAN